MNARVSIIAAVVLASSLAWADEAVPQPADAAVAPVAGEATAAPASLDAAPATETASTPPAEAASRMATTPAAPPAAAEAAGEAATVTAKETTLTVAPVACGRWIAPGMPEGPISLGFNEADVATGRRVCPRTEVSLGERAAATIATEDFYGSIGATSLLSASWAQTPRRELFLTFEGFHYGWTVNAVIESTDVGFGQLTAGASQIVASGDAWATATSARLMLPTSMLVDVRVVGAELGQALTFRPTDWLELHGYAGVDGSAAIFAAPQPKFGAFLNAGVQWNAFSRFAVVLDANARLGGFAWYLAPSAALRFRIANGGGLELAATRPIAGQDRRTVIAGLRLSWRF